MAVDRSKVAARIAALLQQTEARGATAAEAETFMRKARKLMREHNFTAEDLANQTDACIDFAQRTVRTGTEFNIIDEIVLTTIAEFTETKVFKVELDGKFDIRFFGYRVDTELATHLYRVCLEALTSEWNKYLNVTAPGAFRGRTAKYRTKAKVSFQVGIALKLKERLIELMNKDESTGTDLIVLKNQLVVAAFAAAGAPTQETMVVEYDPSVQAFHDGIEAGDSVRFHREVGTPAEVKQLEA